MAPLLVKKRVLLMVGCCLQLQVWGQVLFHILPQHTKPLPKPGICWNSFGQTGFYQQVFTHLSAQHLPTKLTLRVPTFEHGGGLRTARSAKTAPVLAGWLAAPEQKEDE